jgi:hypothetical protein
VTTNEYAAIVIALSVAGMAYYVSRLLSRLERSAQVMDDLMITARRELELTMEQSRSTLAQLNQTGASADQVLQNVKTMGQDVTEQLKKVDKVLNVVGVLVDGLRLNTVLLEKAVANPLSKVTGAWAGISRGVKVWRQIKDKGEKQ